MARKIINIIALMGWIAGISGYIAFNRYINNQFPFTRPPVHYQALDCQYPLRELKDGQCDNSDPCDPTTIKDPQLAGACAPAIKINYIPPPMDPAGFIYYKGGK